MNATDLVSGRALQNSPISLVSLGLSHLEWEFLSPLAARERFRKGKIILKIAVVTASPSHGTQRRTPIVPRAPKNPANLRAARQLSISCESPRRCKGRTSWSVLPLAPAPDSVRGSHTNSPRSAAAASAAVPLPGALFPLPSTAHRPGLLCGHPVPCKDPSSPLAHLPGSAGSGGEGGQALLFPPDSGSLLAAASEDGEVPEPQPAASQAAQPAALAEAAPQQDRARARGAAARGRAGPGAAGALLAPPGLQPPAPSPGAAPQGAVAGPFGAADLPHQEELQQHLCKLSG